VGYADRPLVGVRHHSSGFPGRLIGDFPEAAQNVACQPLGIVTGRSSVSDAPSRWLIGVSRRNALGRIRTCDAGLRRAALYPLSYEGTMPQA
jgi:hypothetical protein